MSHVLRAVEHEFVKMGTDVAAGAVAARRDKSV